MNYLLVCIILLLSFTSPNVEAANTLKPYFTDGCTMFVDGPLKQPKLWLHCCEEHDMRYWFGGSIADMDQTDLRLKACVKKVAGSGWAEIIYRGVRAGHSSPIKNKTHWSWGWVNERANLPLNNIETNYIIEELRRLPYDSEIIENFIMINLKK